MEGKSTANENSRWSPTDKDEDNDDYENDGLNIPEKWFGPEHGTGGYEPDCLINAASNAYFLYEQGLFQVFFYLDSN